MISKRLFSLAAPLFMFGFLSLGCAAQGRVKFEKRELALEAPGLLVPLKAEIARTGAQRSRGLMFRESLADGEGMLFIFEKDQILSFWMKDTLIPLSIAFISSGGRILEIRDMEAGNLNPVHSSRSCRYALEVPLGWFARAGLSPGSRLLLEGLE